MASEYSRSVATYDPNGNIQQLKYASNCANQRGRDFIAAVCNGGKQLVIGRASTKLSKLHKSHVRGIWNISKTKGFTFCGMIADARLLMQRCREECSSWRMTYHEEMPTRILAQRIGLYMHAHTEIYNMRPFGCYITICGIDDGNCELYMLTPGGQVRKWRACTRAVHTAMADLESVKWAELSLDECLSKVAEIILNRDEDTRDCTVLEMSWIKDDKHELVPRGQVDAIVEVVNAMSEDDDDEEDE